MNIENTKTVDDKSVLLVVDFHRLGNTRKVNTAQIEVDADKSMLRVNKSLLDSPEFDAIRTHDGQTRVWLMSRALPSMFKEGVFRVPNTLVVDVDEYLTERSAERKELVKEFRQSYDMRKRQALERLNGIGNERDYLTADEAAGRFGLTWKYMTFATPDSLKNLKEGLFEREKEKLAKVMAEATEEIKVVLRSQLSALVKRMVTQLTPSSDGKQRKIYDSLVGNIEDFLGTFNARNIADDVELKALVEKARSVIRGVDADILRDKGMNLVRDAVKTDFAEIGKKLDAMIMDKPARRFSFDD